MMIPSQSSAASAAPSLPRVLAACFGGIEASTPLGVVLAGLANVEWVDDRRRVHQRVAATSPTMLVLPLRDEAGLSTIVLAHHLLAEHPQLEVVAMASARRGMPRGLARAARHGIAIGWLHEVEGMRELFTRVLGERDRFRRDLARLRRFVVPLGPPPLGEVLVEATRHAGGRLGASDLARAAGLSGRALRRLVQRAGWPAPVELARWARLLRAAMLVDEDRRKGKREGESAMTLAALARGAGFPRVAALRRACARLLGPDVDPARLRPTRVAVAFRDRVRRTGG